MIVADLIKWLVRMPGDAVVVVPGKYTNSVVNEVARVVFDTSNPRAGYQPAVTIFASDE